MKLLLIIVFLGFASCYPAEFDPYSEAVGSSDGEQWGYVRTRRDASLFWWLYHSTHPDGYLNRPLVIWLQGGPGLPGSSLGNFAMFGPVDENGEMRNHTWIQSVNMMYIDSPVGAGFSYLHGNATPTKSLDEVSQDLVSTVRVFLEMNPDFVAMPLYVFGQSYGGKTVPNFGYHLEMARQRGQIDCNLRGLAIGNGLVSPLHTAASYADFLIYMSYIDETEYAVAQEAIAEMWETADTADPSQLENAFWGIMASIPGSHVDVYNVMNPTEPSIYDLDLEPLMEGPVRDHLAVIPPNVTFNGFNGYVYNALCSELDRDVIKSEVPLVDRLLTNSDVQVIVYSGQLDLICSTKGTMDWVDTLTWEGMPEYHGRERLALSDPDTGRDEMFVKAYDQFKFYWVLNSGHAVPRDVPGAALRMLQRIIEDTDH